MNLIKDYNVILNDYCPLRLPSFAKTNTLYKIEYFEELENYICFNGRKLNDRDFLNIIAERQKYVKRTNKNNIIYISFVFLKFIFSIASAMFNHLSFTHLAFMLSRR